MRYGILFKRPKDELRGYSPDSVKNDWYINIEVIHTGGFIMNDVCKFLNKHWNSDKKLMKLQSFGTIYHLGTNFSNTESELSEFKAKYKGTLQTYISDSVSTLGDIDYVIQCKQTGRAWSLVVPMYKFESIEKGIEEAPNYEWDYIFTFMEETKSFVAYRTFVPED